MVILHSSVLDGISQPDAEVGTYDLIHRGSDGFVLYARARAERELA
jgi:hypothetical protein